MLEIGEVVENNIRFFRLANSHLLFVQVLLTFNPYVYDGVY